MTDIIGLIELLTGNEGEQDQVDRVLVVILVVEGDLLDIHQELIPGAIKFLEEDDNIELILIE